MKGTKKVNDSFKVVILGSDINAYYMARNFHEEYGIKSHLIIKTPMYFTSLSKILDYEVVPNLWQKEKFLNALNNYAENNKSSKLILVPSNDNYVRLIAENKKELEKKYLFNCPDIKIVDNLLVKDKFYEFVKDYDIDIPKTYIHNCADEKIIFKKIENFSYPLILKPSDGIKYHNIEFEGQAKVYKIDTEDELVKIVSKIKSSGYDDKLIIQEYIPGDDSMLFDSILYFNTKKEAQLMSFAQIGLQEHAPTGIGNCTVLVNGYNQFHNTDIVKDKLVKFLNDIGYQGFAEFDLKYDIRDNKFKVFEINPRQARSSYYLTACGYNLAKYLIDDLIYNQTKNFKFIDEEMLLTFVPKKVIKKYIFNPELKQEILKLIKQKKYVRPLHYNKDNLLKRKIWLFIRDINYIKKYKKNNW